MTSLRDFETHKGLKQYTNNASSHAVESIVGVQFRNVATIGGSVFGKFGFSDVITFLLALDCKLEFVNTGIMTLQEFLDKPLVKDVLVNIIIEKKPVEVVYTSKRNTKTDFPVLTVCASNMGASYKVVIGARPLKAIVYQQDNLTVDTIDEFVSSIVEDIKVGTNNRGSEDYRRKLVSVLSTRQLKKLFEGESHGN